jgi:Holliday junction resolvase
MSYSVFERELKAILHGDEVVIRRIIKNCDSETSENYLRIIKKPFLVIRAAGSFGVDLVAVRSNIAFPIEVKSSSSKTISLSSERTKKQAQELRWECERSGMFPIYAQRLTGHIKEDPWHVSTIEMEGLRGNQNTVHKRLHKVHVTTFNNIVLKWDENKEKKGNEAKEKKIRQLNEFINYLYDMM